METAAWGGKPVLRAADKDGNLDPTQRPLATGRHGDREAS